MEYIQIFTTFEKKNQAKKIAEILLKEKIAGCIQIIGPVESIYTWRGKIEKQTEWLCFIKTRKNFFKKIEKIIKENHTYETPEIIAVPLNILSKEYLNWLKSETEEKNDIM